MTTTREPGNRTGIRSATGSESVAPTRPAARGGAPAPPQARQRRAFQRYVQAVDEARAREAQALAQLRAELGDVERATDDSRDQLHQGLVPRSQRPRPVRRSAAERRRRAAAIGAIVIAAVFIWLVTRGDDESQQSAVQGAHAGHQSGAAGPVKLAPGTTIAVELGEFFVNTDYGKVRAGEITFDISNTGKAEHELMIADASKLAAKDIARLSSDQVHEQVLAAAHGLAPGSSGKSLEIKLEPGKYILFCNLPGHFAGGQSTVFRVA